MAQRSNRTCIFMTVLLLIVIVVLLAVIIYLAQKDTECTTPVTSNKPVSVFDYFNVKDGLEVTWYQAANTDNELKQALNGNYMMIGADISLRSNDNIPLVGSPANGYTFNQWLDTILEHDKGMKLTISNIEELEPTLRILSARVKNKPVFIDAKVLKGPGGGSTVNHERLIEIVDRTNMDVTLSLGWTSSGCNEAYGRGNVMDMLTILKTIERPVTVSVPDSTLKQSWPQLKSLLDKSGKTSITVTACTASVNQKATSYDLLYVYDDSSRKELLYDIGMNYRNIFKHLVYTAGSPIHYFNITNRDAAKVTWAHAVNSEAKLQAALDDKVMMFEADINLGVGNQTGIPIMAHDAGTYSDLTFADFVQKVLKTKSGLKLDFKSLDVVAPSLKILQEQRSLIKQPVWINADIFQGFSGKVPVNAVEFIKVVKSTFPECVLSIGWTTGRSSSPNPEDDMLYTKSDVQYVADFCKDIKQPITFPIRAAAAKKSWSNLQWLLDQSRSYTLTIWHTSKDSMSKADMNYVRQNSEHDRVYFDLPKDLLPDMN